MVDVDTEHSELLLGTCPANWNNNDIPGWRPHTPFPDILDRMREAGCLATEYDASFGTQPSMLAEEASKRGLELTGSYQWVDFLESGDAQHAYDGLQPTLELLRDIECRNLIVADSLRQHRIALAGRIPADGSASLDDASVRTIADGVHRLADIAARFDIRVRYHNHVGSWIEAPHEVDALLAHLDTSLVDLCFDTGHYAYGGGNPTRFIADHIDEIGYLHLKDVDSDAIVRARQRELSFLDALREIVFSPIGTGTADIPAILSILVDNQFPGWVIVEQDTCAGDPTQTARDNLAFIKTWLDNHGFHSRNGR